MASPDTYLAQKRKKKKLIPKKKVSVNRLLKALNIKTKPKKMKYKSKMAKSSAYKAKNRGKQGYREDQQKHDMGHTRTGKYYLKQGRKIRMQKALGYTRRKPSSGGRRKPSSGGNVPSAYKEIIGMISGGGGK